MALNFIAQGAAVYAAVLGGLYFMQDSMIFPRGAAKTPHEPPPGAMRPLAFQSTDGSLLRGGIVERSNPRFLVIGFSGNAWNARDYLAFLARSIPDGDVAAFHYRGYEPSGGKPSERAFFEDALAIFDKLRAEKPALPIIVMGTSIGSGVAAYLTANRTVAGAVLTTPFDSIRAIASARYPWAPVSALLRHPFDSVGHLASTEAPIAVIAAGDDVIVPPKHTAALTRSLRNLVMFETIPGASHGGLYANDAFQPLLRRAIEALAVPALEAQAEQG